MMALIKSTESCAAVLMVRTAAQMDRLVHRCMCKDGHSTHSEVCFEMDGP